MVSMDEKSFVVFLPCRFYITTSMVGICDEIKYTNSTSVQHVRNKIRS